VASVKPGESPIPVTYRTTIGTDLCPEDGKDIDALLTAYEDCFTDGETVGEVKGIYHRIDTGDARPISTAPRRISFAEKKIIAEQVQIMLDKGVIEPSFSPWSAAVVLIKRKNGTPRFCLDYRCLNAVTKKNVYPMPRADDLLHRFEGAQYFSSMDVRNGFWHIPIHPDDKEKTGFITPEGLFQFKRVPFGASNSPATFMRFMDRVLAGLKWTHCLAYLDDVLVYGSDLPEHNVRLEKVLQAIRNADLKLNPEKCVFAVRSLIYLGHEIDGTGIRPNPEKMDAIRNFPLPTNVQTLRSFLGLTSFFRRFVHQFARIAAPLHGLLKKSSKWHWGEEQENAMQQLKDSLINAPQLVHDNEKNHLVIRTDASKGGLGATISILRDKKEWPVTFISRRTSAAEENYHSNELECLALVWALEKLRHHLYGRPFIVYTDNSPLKWLCTKKKLEGRLARWILALQEYDFTVQHVKGVENGVADALSRNPVGEPEETDPTAHMDVCALVTQPFLHADLALLQQGDPTLGPILLEARKVDGKNPSGYHIYRDALYKENPSSGRSKLLVVPSILRRQIVESCHDFPAGGHNGIAKTLHRVMQRYWWPGLDRNVKAYVASCRSCQLNKPSNQRPQGLLMPIPPPSEPFDTIGVDHLGPFKTKSDGFKHIFVIMDYATKWLIAVPVADTTTNGVVKVPSQSVSLSIESPEESLPTEGQRSHQSNFPPSSTAMGSS